MPYTDQQLPDTPIRWEQSDGTPWDYSTGWTFAVELVNRTTGAIAHTKTTGITGGAGASGAANLVIAWVAADRTTPGAGIFYMRVIAIRTADSKRNVFRDGNLPTLTITEAPS